MRLDFVSLLFRISANIYDCHKEQSPVWNEKLRETLSEMAFLRNFLFLNGWFQAYVYWKLTGVSYWLPSPQKNCWVSWCCTKSYAFVYAFFYHCISSCDNWVPLVFLIFLQHTIKLHLYEIGRRTQIPWSLIIKFLAKRTVTFFCWREKSKVKY